MGNVYNVNDANVGENRRIRVARAQQITGVYIDVNNLTSLPSSDIPSDCKTNSECIGYATNGTDNYAVSDGDKINLYYSPNPTSDGIPFYAKKYHMDLTKLNRNHVTGPYHQHN